MGFSIQPFFNKARKHSTRVSGSGSPNNQRHATRSAAWKKPQANRHVVI
jgi:hypothetical protein